MSIDCNFRSLRLSMFLRECSSLLSVHPKFSALKIEFNSLRILRLRPWTSGLDRLGLTQQCPLLNLSDFKNTHMILEDFEKDKGTKNKAQK